MAELVTDNIRWKKGETGTQIVHFYDSDGITKKDISGITYTFKFWVKGAGSLKGSATLTNTDPTNGIAQFTVSSSFTDTVEQYLGEFEGDNGNDTKTIHVYVEDSAPA